MLSVKESTWLGNTQLSRSLSTDRHVKNVTVGLFCVKPRARRLIQFGGRYTKKFGLISSRTPNEARAERVVALT